MENFISRINKMKAFKIEDQYYLYDGYSGRVLNIEEEVFQFIKKCKFFLQVHDSNSLEKMLFENSEFSTLERKISAIDYSDNLKGKSLLSAGIENSKGYGLNSLWLNVVHTCNMKCKYCFVDNGSYGDKSGYMDQDIAIQAVEKWLNNLDTKQKTFNVIFFGGEPLLNWELIEYIVKTIDSVMKKKQMHCRYYLTTNATIFNKKISDLIELHDFVFSISIDGLDWIHNYNRPLANGHDSYELVRKNVKALLNVDPKAIANMVVRREDIPFIVDSVEELWKMGFMEVKVVLSMECQIDLSFDDLIEYKEQMEQLAYATYKNILKEDNHVVENFIEIFSSISSRNNCGGCALYNDRVMVVSPDGNEFKCYKQISGNKDAQGHKFVEECDKCWAVSLCDEGCPLDHEIFTGDFYKRSEELCNRSKCLFDIALKLYIQFANNGQDKLKKYYLWRFRNEIK